MLVVVQCVMLVVVQLRVLVVVQLIVLVVVQRTVPVVVHMLIHTTRNLSTSPAKLIAYHKQLRCEVLSLVSVDFTTHSWEETTSFI